MELGSVTLKINTQNTHGVGVPGTPPFGAPEGVLYGMELGSVTLKIDNQHTRVNGSARCP
jgi:hypothetical protein